jgi:hypothetical protein
VEEILKRVWDNLIARATGPMNFRLMIQPAVASFLAIRAGLKVWRFLICASERKSATIVRSDKWPMRFSTQVARPDKSL